MKNLFLCVICIAFVGVVAVSAQEQKQTKPIFGIRAGLNLTDLHRRVQNQNASYDSKASFHAGVVYKQPLVKNAPLYLETGLYVAGQGARFSMSGSTFDSSFNYKKNVKAEIDMLYLQIPILITQHFNYKNVSFQPAVGAYYGFGVSGKLKATMGGRSVEADLFKDSEFGAEKVPQEFKRSDIGIRIHLGLAIYKHYLVALGYDFGALNIFKEKSSAKMRNRNFYVSLGYNF